MTLLNVERIKLFSTRSPYWCVVLILALGVLISTLVAVNSHDEDVSITSSQAWAQFGLMVAMVMAALAVTTEYRFGTIRNSLLAVPKRGSVLASKTIVVAGISAFMGLLTSIITYFLTHIITGNPGGRLDIDSATDWRILLGNTLTFALAAVIAVAVGTLIRQSAGAVSILLLWPLLIENLFNLFGNAGEKIARWLPFAAGSRFTQADDAQFDGQSFGGDSVPNWWQGILVFAATAAVLWIIALVVLKRRDA